MLADPSHRRLSSPALELALCRLHQRNHCVLVSSGTVGTVLALKALGLERAYIAIPSGVCLNVPLAIKYVDATPIYCDIDPGTLGLSSTTLLASGMLADAVLAVHAYGNVCDIDSLEGYCKSASIPLLEDVAVAQGGMTVHGRPLGSFGEASVLSFGRGKIVDVGGGGAVLTDDMALVKNIRELQRRLPMRCDSDAKKLEAFSAWHTRLYNQHYGKNLSGHIAPFVDMALELRDATLTRFDWDQAALALKLETLAGNLRRRRSLMEYFFGRLEECTIGVSCHRASLGSVAWRAGIFVPKYRDGVLRALLAQGVKISSWYPPAQEFLESTWNGEALVAWRVGREILNVWVNEAADIAYLDSVTEAIAGWSRKPNLLD